MYSIGTFSKLVDVSVKTLRYYHEIGLLSPSYIDPKTNYRYYNFDKFSEIEKIKLFRSFGLSLDEIKDLIATDSTNIDNLLVEQKTKLIKKKFKIEEQLSLIDDMLTSDKKAIEMGSNYSISHVKFEEKKERIALSVREDINLNNINSLVKKLFEKAYAYDIQLIGNLMATITVDKPLCDVEVMMEISEESLSKQHLTDVKMIESGQYAYLYFKGLYSDLYKGYEKLNEYAVGKSSFFIEEYVEGLLLPEELDKPLLIRPNRKKHPQNFITKLLLKL